MPLWPMLFVFLGCGAISGGHALLGTGATSKQIDKESDVRFVAIGAFALELLIAVTALCALLPEQIARSARDNDNDGTSSGVW